MNQQPSVGRVVHYVSYGTPGGEFSSVCRSATVTEVGAWVQFGEPREEGTALHVGADGERNVPTRVREISQRWESATCALMVQNPTGLFFNTCAYSEDKDPGTWHWPERV